MIASAPTATRTPPTAPPPPNRNTAQNPGTSKTTNGRSNMEALAAAEEGADPLSLKEIGKQGAAHLGHVATDLVTNKVKEEMGGLVKLGLQSQVSQIGYLLHIPGPREILSWVIKNVFHPYYQKINPNTTTTADEIIEQLKKGETEFVEKDLLVAFDKFIKDSLPDDAARARYESGDKLFLLPIFTKMAKDTVKEPGGIKNFFSKICNLVPFSDKIPEIIKPFAGVGAGLIGLGIAYGVLRIIINMTFGMLSGIPIIGGLFGGGGNYQRQEMAA